MNDGGDLDAGEREQCGEPEKQAAGATVAESPVSEVCQEGRPPPPQRQLDRRRQAQQSSSGKSEPDLDSRPKEDTSDQGSMWQEVVSSPECPPLTAKVGQTHTHLQQLQCLVMPNLLTGPHTPPEDTELVKSATTLSDKVQQSPACLISDTSEKEDQAGGCGDDDGYGDDDDDAQTDECPVCSELYRPAGTWQPALLNCDHTLCEGCLSKMVRRAADPSRVQCPLCRQRTPLLRWEIQRMQEETASFGAVMAAADLNGPFLDSLSPSPPLSLGSRFLMALEQYLRARAETDVVCGCFRRPRCLARALARSQHTRRHCWCHVALLLALGAAELAPLLLVFLPVLTLVLLFTLVGR